MSDSNIIIYEKDSVDMTFTLDSNNSIITSFSATDKIIWALRQFNSGAAIILKEYTGVTGTTVTVSLTKEDTFKLRPQKYVYDLAVLRGSNRQTTVVKSASFLVADRSVQPKESATITLDTLTEYRTLIATIRGYSDSASQYASNAAASASSASSSLASINTLASSVSASKASVDASKASVDASVSQFNTTVANAKSSIETQTSQSINKVVAAELTARFDAEKCATNATSAAASALAAANSQTAAANSATNAATSATTASTAAQNTVSVYNEIQESTGALIEAASQAQPLMEQLAQKTAELLEAAEQTEQSVTAATNAATTAQGYANNASTSATVAGGYATTIESKIEVVNNKINELSSATNQIAENTSDISSLQSGKQDVISDIDTIRSNASTGAGLSSQVSTNTSSISSLNSSVNALNTNVSTLSGSKADKSTTYTKTEVDTSLSGKADKSTTLEGYGIANAYTKTEADTIYSGKADKSTTYTKTEADELYNGKLNLSGGTMSGTLYTSSNIYKSINTDMLIIGGGTNWNNGGSLTFVGKEQGGANAGACILRGHNGTNYAEIALKPDGTTSAPTPATTDNSTKIATTQYVRNSSVAKTGDVMSGTLSVSSGGSTVDVSAGRIEISHTTPYIDFHFNKSSNDYTTRIVESSEGNLCIASPNRTSNTQAPIECISASGTNYIRYASGIQICWGTGISCKTDTSGYYDYSFPVSFSVAPSVSVGEIERMSYHHLSVWNATSSKLQVCLRDMSTKTVVASTSFNLQYIAIGKWK